MPQGTGANVPTLTISSAKGGIFGVLTGDENGVASVGQKALVVDDSPTFRRAIGAMLERAGYRVETASSGEEAFQRCFDEHFDVVVSDITMGALSGVQLCRLFRSDPATKDIPVVLLTAADDPRSRFWGRNAGAAAYVAKERARQDLLGEVARVLKTSPTSTAPVRTRAGRRAQPLERLSQVLDELLFRAVVSSEVRNLINHTGDRVQFCRHLLQIAGEVCDYSYLVLTLRDGDQPTFTVHARGPWHQVPSRETLLALELPGGDDRPEERRRPSRVSNELLAVPFTAISVLHDGEPLTTPDPGIEVKDRVKFNISSGGEVLGSLCAIARDKRLGGDDRTTLELLSKELSLLVKNLFLSEETRRLANNDGLTGLQNRRRTTERLEVEVARARRYGTPLAVAMCDVDHFKQVNDRFGHNMGDEVLVEVGRALQHTLREVDLVGRWGGEEFLVLLPDTDVTGAEIVGERLRAGIEALPPFNAGPERVTCSVGVACFESSDSTSGFVDRADQALYRAKKAGRNRWEMG
jgi:two-component system cell cycle response regulator